MKTWYSCKVKYNKETEEGSIKQVTDAFLVDSVTYTEAESRMNEIAARDIHGEFLITNITKTNIMEVIPDDDAFTWFKCKVVYSTIDADSEKEMKINTYLLVAAQHIRQAFEKIEDHFRGTMVPYEIPSITQTQILEVYPYVEGEVPANLTPLSQLADSN
jgi:hypothetical protein